MLELTQIRTQLQALGRASQEQPRYPGHGPYLEAAGATVLRLQKQAEARDLVLDCLNFPSHVSYFPGTDAYEGRGIDRTLAPVLREVEILCGLANQALHSESFTAEILRDPLNERRTIGTRSLWLLNRGGLCIDETAFLNVPIMPGSLVIEEPRVTLRSTNSVSLEVDLERRVVCRLPNGPGSVAVRIDGQGRRFEVPAERHWSPLQARWWPSS